MQPGQPLPYPAARDIVLIGGGHTHALVLRSWGMAPLPGVRLTVIDPKPSAPYSGMLPGHVAGHYPREALDIDLVRLARFAGARLIVGAADGIDPGARTISVPGRPPIAFDIASVDVGITSAMPTLPGFAKLAVPAKPLGPFATAWSAYLAGDRPAQVAVIGGGVAGAELAMAMAHALRGRGRAAQVHLIERAKALTAVRPASRRILLSALKTQGVQLHEDTAIKQLTAQGVETDSGLIPADFITGAAGALAYPWLAQSGLEASDGFLTVGPTLQTSDPAVFAVGDCAHMAFAPRPKAGVYAVRQAPVLLHNLRAAAMGRDSLKHYKPQSDYLKLISLGGKRALGERFGLPLTGGLMWRWKDRIDQAFMDKFRDLPAMPAEPVPAEIAEGAVEALGDKPLCGGCGAKVGPAALAQIGVNFDDAAPLDDLIISHDHLRAFWDDPVVMTRIAALHALSDIWARGAHPRAGLAALTLPRAAEALQARMLDEIMQAARDVFGAVGADIIGGHTSVGAELTIGFTVIGGAAQVAFDGGRPGDALILTKPIGSGTIMAAEMMRDAPGDVVAAALQAMQDSQAAASAILARAATAMTDVTGFGLAGHLAGMAEACGTGADIVLNDVRLMPGALDCAGRGHRSSLFAANRARLPDMPADGAAALLFDPQTSGGLLAAVPSDLAESTCTELRKAGYEPAIIGRLTQTKGVRLR